MGADGHIDIWNRETVLEVWPDADELIKELPNAYRHTLDGAEYYHAYYGDNMTINYTCMEDWLLLSEAEEERILSFAQWLEGNVLAYWEVWT